MDGLVLGQQLSAGRALINVSQRVLACAAGLHVNSIRYLERQERRSRSTSSSELSLRANFYSVKTGLHCR